MERLHFTNFNLAGFTYWDGLYIFEHLKIGLKLRIEREMDNKYDPKAVAIYFEEYKLGYIPRAQNSEIAKLCEQGYADIFDVRINRISPDEDPEEQIGITIHLMHASTRLNH